MADGTQAQEQEKEQARTQAQAAQGHGLAERIVVGVDGSGASEHALGWALRLARLTGGEIDAVTAWEIPPSLGWNAIIDYDLEPGAAETLHRSVEAALAANPGAEVRISETVGRGNTAQILIERAREADLLVVGNRGMGGFTGALLGSVSQHVVQRATCPVVVVRTDDHKD
ncbi:universal stress protein [Phaeacidiphilus oryzae]|uniref:universal stress protein n=1 Tax=Phaeacidiphilus oryzae TaxID=348818 RepID=UPI000A075678|nr:universal stress protein [Phaeacidiphilus oryzae]